MQNKETIMNFFPLKKLSLLFVFLLTAALASPMLSACGKKGDAEKAGEKVDEAIEDTKDAAEDAVDKDGPVEDAGEKVDDAVD
jgi:hypothetical protein